LKSLICAALPIFSTSGQTQETDAEGCKDSSLISRFPGSTIHCCENRKQGVRASSHGPRATPNISRVIITIGMSARAKAGATSSLSGNFQTAPKNGNFTVDFADFFGQLVDHKGSSLMFIDSITRP